MEVLEKHSRAVGARGRCAAGRPFDLRGPRPRCSFPCCSGSGSDVVHFFERLFALPRNPFSFELALVAEWESAIVGVAIAVPDRRATTPGTPHVLAGDRAARAVRHAAPSAGSAGRPARFFQARTGRLLPEHSYCRPQTERGQGIARGCWTKSANAPSTNAVRSRFCMSKPRTSRHAANSMPGMSFGKSAACRRGHVSHDAEFPGLSRWRASALCRNSKLWQIVPGFRSGLPQDPFRLRAVRLCAVCIVQRCLSVPIHDIDIDAFLDEKLDDIYPPGMGSPEQCGSVVLKVGRIVGYAPCASNFRTCPQSSSLERLCTRASYARRICRAKNTYRLLS